MIEGLVRGRATLNWTLISLYYIPRITQSCRNGVALAGFTDDLFHHAVGSGRDCRPVFCAERTKQRVRSDAGIKAQRFIHLQYNPCHLNSIAILFRIAIALIFYLTV